MSKGYFVGQGVVAVMFLYSACSWRNGQERLGMVWSSPSWHACFYSALVFIGVVGVKVSWYWLTCSLLKKGRA